MQNGGPLSDAELVSRLQIYEKHGISEGSKLLGISGEALRRSTLSAKSRGLKSTSPIVDETAQLTLRLRAVERELANVHRENLSVAMLRKELFGLSEVTPKAPAWSTQAPPSKKDSTFSVPVTIWSDWHWGEIVRKSEVGGVNEFNRKIAKDRLKRLVGSTIDLARHHMGVIRYPGIVIALGGDMISGLIHEDLRETNDGTVQQTLIELQDELVGALTVMADQFGKVFVPCVVGNHGRMKMKPHAKHRAFESFEWNLYQQLERYFAKDPRFTFMIPDGPDVRFDVLGHRFMLTHGDALGTKGGDGMIGAIGPITRGAIKIGRSEAQIGRDFDTLVIGHWHSYMPRSEASGVICNGTLKGYDEFAHTILRVPYSRASQALWFVHAKYGITAQWQVFLDEQRAAAKTEDWVRFNRV